MHVCGFFFFNKPEEDQLLLVLVLPQKRHQAVELVFSSADLKRRQKNCIIAALSTLGARQCEADQTHCVVVGESGGRLLDGGGGHAFLFDSDADWVPEAGPHQLLQLLRLRG